MYAVPGVIPVMGVGAPIPLLYVGSEKMEYCILRLCIAF